MVNKGRFLWVVVRTITFVIVGLFNTVFIQPEDIGTWKNYLGYGLLILALIDVILLIKNRNKKIV